MMESHLPASSSKDCMVAVRVGEPEQLHKRSSSNTATDRTFPQELFTDAILSNDSEACLNLLADLSLRLLSNFAVFCG